MATRTTTTTSTMDTDNANPRGVPNIQFDPDKHPFSTLKAFNEFIEQYEFRYDAQYPDVPRHMMESAVEKWKSARAADAPDITAAQKETLRADVRSRDKVRKLLGFFATLRLQQDWKAAEPNENNRNYTWKHFVDSMRAYYKPTENSTLRNYEFRQLYQKPAEPFHAFCNRVEKEGNTCTFCECAADAGCSSTTNAVRDQIVIGTNKDKIREQALLKGWNLVDLRSEGMKMESASRGEDSISSATVANINKMGAYSFGNLKNAKDQQKQYQTPKPQNPATGTGKKCYRCGDKFSRAHMQSCRGIGHNCTNCGKKDHLEDVCKTRHPPVRVVAKEEVPTPEEVEVEEQIYELNVWAVDVKSGKKKFRTRPTVDTDVDFKFRLVINNKVVQILADTGAKISVCGEKQARAWGTFDRMVPSKVKILPYCSDPIQVMGVATCGVTYNDRTVPVHFHILPGSCSPILAGTSAVQLSIISLADRDGSNSVFNPVNMIHTEESSDEGKKFSSDINRTLLNYPENFSGLGKLQGQYVKLYDDPSFKQVVSPPRVIPYHLTSRFNEALDKMIEEDVIERHPIGEPAPWISCPVIVPKPDGSIRITLDARNVNKAVQSNNHPIPRYEDIKAKLAGKRFSAS